MSAIRIFVPVFFLLICKAAFAEGNCPSGYFPAQGSTDSAPRCAPIFNASTMSGAGTGYSPEPPNPGPRWQFRWGAIAVDAEAGYSGGADGFLTPTKAKRAAEKECRKNGGGKGCKIVAEYHNQCGALVWGIDKYVAYSGPVTEEVIRRGMESCNKITSDCQIYYAGCSYPVEIE
jgi:hypothetical protein